ncbi:hypothetical protein TSMG0131 [Halocynthia phage JM-2012]|uniref:hypothetical protein n=1 Tax=Halocynthia phage JM-2012 TaxID=1173297 RepID=UPI00025C695F|nr:hypothetical protein TSMG0131 [Halocynthia phage JM-2012]AFI55414.1 hypothetical protein TSMG0131 [Halocynthia phage JM-2012]
MLHWKEPAIASDKDTHHLHCDELAVSYVYCGGEEYSTIDYNFNTVTLRTLNGTLIRTMEKKCLPPPVVTTKNNNLLIHRHGVKVKSFPLLNKNITIPANELFRLIKESRE